MNTSRGEERMSMISVNQSSNATAEETTNVQVYVETEKNARALESHALMSLKANIALLEEFHKKLAFVLHEVEYQIRKR